MFYIKKFTCVSTTLAGNLVDLLLVNFLKKIKFSY